MITIINIEPYNFTLHFSTTQKELLVVCPNVNLNDTLGITTKENNVFFLGVFDKTLNTLVHELFHLMVFISEHIGEDISPTNQEHYAYLTGCLFDKIVKQCKDKKIILK